MNSKPRLRIGIPGDYLPFGIIDENSPAGFSGHDIDLAQALCREAGLAPVFVLTSWPELFRCQVTMVADNASIPARIASEIGDVMITDSFEARWYAARDVRLTLALGGQGLTPKSWKTMLIRRCARMPVLPGADEAKAPLLAPRLLAAWGRLERAGVLAELTGKWLGA